MFCFLVPTTLSSLKHTTQNRLRPALKLQIPPPTNFLSPREGDISQLSAPVTKSTTPVMPFTKMRLKDKLLKRSYSMEQRKLLDGLSSAQIGSSQPVQEEEMSAKLKFKNLLLKRTCSYDEIALTNKRVPASTMMVSPMPTMPIIANVKSTSNLLSQSEKDNLVFDNKHFQLRRHSSQKNEVKKIFDVPVKSFISIMRDAIYSSPRFAAIGQRVLTIPRLHRFIKGLPSDLSGVVSRKKMIPNKQKNQSILDMVCWVLNEKHSIDMKDSESDTKPLVKSLVMGHQCPVLDSQTHTTFCTQENLQPMYVPLSRSTTKSNKVSMYSQWKVASYDPNPSGLSTLNLLQLYESERHNRPSNSQLFNTAPSNEEQTGVLTHSSYWKFYKKDMKNEKEESFESVESKTEMKTEEEEKNGK